MSRQDKADDSVGANPASSADEQALISSEIFEVTSYTQRQPIKREFKPWHKPRKQVVREEQWGREVDWLLGRKLPGDRSLRYLGLPGADLLDIRYLYDRFCKTGDHELTFLGFDESATAASTYREALNISLSEVRSLEYIDKQSNVLGDDFRRLADRESIAWDTAQRLGPFDVINIDLCDHLTRDEPAIDLSIYNAIYQLCGLQQRRRRPWALFLTSRIDRTNVAEGALPRLLNALKRNVDRCAAFAAVFGGDFGIADVSNDAAKAWDDGKFFSAMTVALTKWMLGFAQPMRNVLSISSTIGYRVWPAAPYLDMLSIVLRFEPADSIPADELGLASASPVFPDECDQAAKLPGRVSAIVDIDKELGASNELWQRFRESAALLLQQARYDPEQYRKWADEQRGPRS